MFFSFYLQTAEKNNYHFKKEAKEIDCGLNWDEEFGKIFPQMKTKKTYYYTMNHLDLFG
jgi:hypothetical protein